MAGRKFGSTGHEDLTWAMNAYVPALVAEAFVASRIVAFSTGNVYPWVNLGHGGATEATPALPPAGTYANSCVARENIFQYFSRTRGTPGRIIRLNYAIDMRYGVLHDIASRVMDGTPINLAAGHVNVIWQGDANAMVLRSLAHCTVPSSPINVSGPEHISTRWLATEFGKRLGKTPVFEGTEATEGWLTNTAEAMRLFGYPTVPLATLIDWVADWVGREHAEPRQGHALRFARWHLLIRPRSQNRRCWPPRSPDAEALVREAGWNQTAADWRAFLELGTVYAIRANDGRVIATAATLPYGGQFAWISMVLVARDYQRRGLATRLLRKCIDDLTAAKLVPVLDATPAGPRGLSRSRLSRLVGISALRAATRYEKRRQQSFAAGHRNSQTSRTISGRRCALTTPRVFGADRSKLLARLRGRAPHIERVAERDGKIAGFVLGRDGRIATQIGPLVADNDDVARALLTRALDAIRRPGVHRRSGCQDRLARLSRRAWLCAATAAHPHAAGAQRRLMTTASAPMPSSDRSLVE